MESGQETLTSHLHAGQFLAGVARRRWRLGGCQWPIVIVEVNARDGRWFALRFDCTGYPGTAPTATLWDTSAGHKLGAEMWPRGGRVSQVFNYEWLKGEALYLPCDRRAFLGHEQWVGEHPWLIWDPSKGLIQYITAIWEVLHSHELQSDAA